MTSTVWQDMFSNHLSAEQAAENWNLPVSAIHEVMEYCAGHRDLLKLAAEEEQYRLEARGMEIEPKSVA